MDTVLTKVNVKKHVTNPRAADRITGAAWREGSRRARASAWPCLDALCACMAVFEHLVRLHGPV